MEPDRMSGTRTMDPLARLIARQVPTYQIPIGTGRGNFRYPQFGGEPRGPAPLPAQRVGAAPVTQVPGSSAANGGSAEGGGLAGVRAGAYADSGASQGDVTSPTDLGPDPAQINSFADLAQDVTTFSSIARGIATANPVATAMAIANSPIGRGLAKGFNSMMGVQSPHISTFNADDPASKESVTNPADEQQAQAPTLGSTIGGMVGFGFGGPSRGRSKGEAPAEEPADPTQTAPAPAAATPTAAAAAPAPAPAPAAEPPAIGDAPAGKDFGGAPSESFNAENTTPGSESKNDSYGGSDGGKGDAAGTGANGENSSPGGDSKRFGGITRADTDGHLAEVPIIAHENEFVLSPEATAMIGPDLLQRINDMALEAAGHPPRPMDPRFTGANSPLGQLRAGSPPPTFVSVRARAPQAVPPPGGYADPGVAAWDQQAARRGEQAAQQGMADHMGMQGQGVPSAAPLPMPPPAPPGAPPRGMARAQPRGMSADDLNAMSLGIAQGTGTPPQGAQERLAFERIRARMRPGEEPQQFRMGGLVQGPAAAAMPASMKGRGLMPEESDTYDHEWGQSLPHGMMGWALSPMPTLGYEGEDAGPQGPMEFGYEDLMARFGGDEPMPAFRMGGMVEAPQAGGQDMPMDEGAGMPGSFLPRSARPYADEGQGDMPFGDDPATRAGAGEHDVAQRLMALPPDMQQAVAMAIGGNPMVASALLQVLGPHFGPIIQAAMKVASPPQPDPIEQLAGGGMPMGAPMGPMG
jgi:hypothetical protein